MGWFTKNTTESKTDLQEILGIITPLLTNATPEQDLKILMELDLRVEALELKQETLKKECLRYLRSGATRHQKAEELLDDGEIEGAAITPDIAEQVAQIQNPTTNGATEIEKIQAIIRASGITPILG